MPLITTSIPSYYSTFKKHPIEKLPRFSLFCLNKGKSGKSQNSRRDAQLTRALMLAVDRLWKGCR